MNPVERYTVLTIWKIILSDIRHLNEKQTNNQSSFYSLGATAKCFSMQLTVIPFRAEEITEPFYGPYLLDGQFQS